MTYGKEKWVNAADVEQNKYDMYGDEKLVDAPEENTIKKTRNMAPIPHPLKWLQRGTVDHARCGSSSKNAT
jgi:hypothetical protein